MKKNILITGSAGFIGFHLALHLKNRGDFVVGIDNFNAYYSPRLKKDRSFILAQAGIEVVTADICQREVLFELLQKCQVTHVVHLAAQAGVRHSLKCPDDYVTSNLQGFVSILEACRRIENIKLIYASSSSVYGLNKKVPFSTEDPTDSPSNLYGATKKANELMAHAYHHLYGLSVTALRYFTVYGPWGRPDMAYYRFAHQICQGLPISVFNHGQMQRDFTYIDDIVRGTTAAIDLSAPYEIFNLGHHNPTNLLHFITFLEEALGRTAIKEMHPMQEGEVLFTHADITYSQQKLGFYPQVSLKEGLQNFVDWYYNYHSSDSHKSVY